MESGYDGKTWSAEKSFLTAFLTAWHVLSAVFFADHVDGFRDTVLHLLRVVHIPVHREGGGGMTEAHLYLFRADLLLGEEAGRGDDAQLSVGGWLGCGRASCQGGRERERRGGASWDMRPTRC